ncbi:MAG: hypothetical protein ACRDGK_02570 [Actinomycetota bacterium]
MDGSTHAVVVATRPKMLGARALILAVIVVATLVASFAMGRLTARPDDGNPPSTGTSQVVPEARGGPPHHGGDVKRG